MKLRIDQFVPYLGYGDAISSHSLWIRDTVRRWGYRSTIYAEIIDPRMRSQGEPLAHYNRMEEGDKNIFHYCTASPLSNFVLGLNREITLIYQNITPHDYFLTVNLKTAQSTRKAREELARFADVAELALGASEFSRLELESVGFRRTGVLPIALDATDLEVKPDSKLMRDLDGPLTNFLFVGRIAPNKKQEDVLKVFAYYSKVIEPNARLFLAGSSSGTEVYLEWLKGLAGRLKLDNVYFTGHITQSELLAYYKRAHAFVCMSEHEGFCVPLIESMYLQVPIVAYTCPGVAWTLGDAGIQVKAKEYDIIAETLHALISDRELRQMVIEKQNERLQYFAPERIERILGDYMGVASGHVQSDNDRGNTRSNVVTRSLLERD